MTAAWDIELIRKLHVLLNLASTNSFLLTNENKADPLCELLTFDFYQAVQVIIVCNDNNEL